MRRIINYPEGLFLTLSTSHITEKDNDILSQICRYKRDLNSMLQVLPCDYGYVLFPSQFYMLEELKKDCAEHGLDFSVWGPLLKYCKKHRYTMLRLDRDGEKIPELKHFDW